jgi:hypothetical protein
MKAQNLFGASLLPLLAATGCGGSGPEGPVTQTTGIGAKDTTAAETTPAAPAVQSTAPVEVPANPVSISGWVHAPDGTVLTEAGACLHPAGGNGTGPCTTTGSDGSFTLSGARANDSVTVVFQKDGYLPALRAITLTSSDVVLPQDENVLVPSTAPQMVMGTPADSEKGQLEFVVTSPGSQPPPNVSVTIEQFMIAGIPSGPYSPIYLNADGTVAAGATAGSRGGFLNLSSGTYALRFAAAGVKCVANSGLYGYPVTSAYDPNSGEASVTVPVAAGMVTSPVGVSCTQ